jgi:hypothetical protein
VGGRLEGLGSVSLESLKNLLLFRDLCSLLPILPWQGAQGRQAQRAENVPRRLVGRRGLQSPLAWTRFSSGSRDVKQSH